MSENIVVFKTLYCCWLMSSDVSRAVLSTGQKKECCVTATCRWIVYPPLWTVISSVGCFKSATSPGSVDLQSVRTKPVWKCNSICNNPAVVGCQPQEGYLMVRQFQYLSWAGHRDVPASKRSFMKLILQVDQWKRKEEGEGRTIVHCLWVGFPPPPTPSF